MMDEKAMRKEFRDFMHKFVNKYNCRIRIDYGNELVAINADIDNNEVYSPEDEESVQLYYDALDRYRFEPDEKQDKETEETE